MANRTRHASLASASTRGNCLSKAARRTVRQAARLANELDLSSFEAAGIVWHRRVVQQPPAPAPGAAPTNGRRTRACRLLQASTARRQVPPSDRKNAVHASRSTESFTRRLEPSAFKSPLGDCDVRHRRRHTSCNRRRPCHHRSSRRSRRRINHHRQSRCRSRRRCRSSWCRRSTRTSVPSSAWTTSAL